MVTNELLEYIKQEHLKGVSLEDIKKLLLGNGWMGSDVEEAFKNLYPPVVNNISQGFSAQSTQPVTPIQKPIQQPVQTFSQPKVETYNPVSNGIINPNSVSSLNPATNTMINPFGNKLINQQITPKKSKLKIILVIIIIFIVIILGAGAAYGYYIGYFDSPAKIMEKTMSALVQVKSDSFDNTTVIDWSNLKNNEIESALPTEVGSVTKVTFNFKGGNDYNDPQNIKSSLEFGLDAGAINTALEFRFINKVFYAVVKKMPKVSMIGDLSSFENKWISFALENGPNDIANPMNPMASLGIDPKVFNGLTEEQKSKFVEITKNANFIKNVKKLSNEDINSESTYHLTFDLDVDGIKTYVLNVEDYMKTISATSLPVTFSKEDLDSLFSSFKLSGSEVWISRKDSLPRKLVINLSISDSEKPENGEVAINSVTNFSNWNQSIPVVAPNESQTIEEIFVQFEVMAKDAEIKSRISAIQPNAIVYFENNPSKKNTYKGLCLSKPVKDFLTEVKNISGEKSDIYCLDSKSKFVITSQLSDSTYFCIDSTGLPKTMTQKPFGLSCE